MAEIVLDANVLVAFFDEGDSLRAQALDLLERLEQGGHDYVLLDVCVAETISVICRRAEERSKRKATGKLTKDPPDLGAILERVEQWARDGEIKWVAQEAERLHAGVFDLIRKTNGVLNFNDALLVALERDGLIDDVASFDPDFDLVPGFRRIS